ncbi:VOC family protein [Acetobacterium sp.]|uniref:VOC family protein n=1 Tax=Acetobacterium sp. TaxID=1872094 RepID=UPI003593A9EF
MQIQPYISFNGNCQEAVEFYADVFGTDIPEIILFGDRLPEPEAVEQDRSDKVVIRADLEADEIRMLLSATPQKSPDIQKDKMTLVIFSDDLDEIKILYYKLKDGGTVEMELQETFWSKVYGSLVDKFGVSWQLNYDDGRMSQVV